MTARMEERVLRVELTSSLFFILVTIA